MCSVTAVFRPFSYPCPVEGVEGQGVAQATMCIQFWKVAGVKEEEEGEQVDGGDPPKMGEGGLREVAP